jgi:hypothetical protein
MRLDVDDLDVWGLALMELDTGWSCAIICLSGHFFLDLCFLSFEEGALGSYMPT